MIASLELLNYRGFKAFGLQKLSRVNLLVGKNNCGKTSLLEATRLLVSHGDPSVLEITAKGREETLYVESERESIPDISHFFHGHALEAAASLSISAWNSFGGLLMQIVDSATAEVDLREQTDFLENMIDRDLGKVAFWLVTKWKHNSSDDWQLRSIVPISESGALLLYPRRFPPHLRNQLLRQRVGVNGEDAQPVQLITPRSLTPRSMGEMWNTVQRDGLEENVHEALRIIEPDIDKIVFLIPDDPPRGAAPILVAFNQAKTRIPLGSLGDGMRRMLALSLCLIQSRKGLLLVDEIDTGLHHSIMDEMWRLIVTASMKNDIQVFATTHSLDCVRGLAEMSEKHPELGKHVSMHRIDARLDRSVSFDAEQIAIAAEQDIEVR